jgi:hypothetical protein
VALPRGAGFYAWSWRWLRNANWGILFTFFILRVVCRCRTRFTSALCGRRCTSTGEPCTEEHCCAYSDERMSVNGDELEFAGQSNGQDPHSIRIRRPDDR